MIHSPRQALRRVCQTLQSFDNGVGVLSELVRGSDELSFHTRDGVTISIPNVPGARVPVYELFAEDAYRIAWLVTGLPDGFGAFDIGGHVGCFSVALSASRPDSRVWAFEASPSTAAYTQRNVTQNDMENQVTVVNVALSSKPGMLEFADNAKASGLNGITAPEGTQTIEIPAITFADALDQADRPIRLVKIDTEGAEYDIVLGSDPAQWADVERVVLEYHDVPSRSWSDLEEFFTQAGLHVIDREDAATGRIGTVWLSRTPVSAPA